LLEDTTDRQLVLGLSHSQLLPHRESKLCQSESQAAEQKWEGVCLKSVKPKIVNAPRVG
jgi:hypothetical protein